MTYDEVVKELRNDALMFDASGVSEHVAVQFNIYGEGEGALYIEISDGRLNIQPYEYYDRDALVYLEASTLLDLASGKLSMKRAYEEKKIVVQGKHDAVLAFGKLHLVGSNDYLSRLYLEMIELYAGDPGRIQHFSKVHSYARLIGEAEDLKGKELFILEAAALTHDIGIHVCEEKYGNCDGHLQEEEGPVLAAELFEKVGISKDVSERVQHLIGHHHTYTDIDAMDYQILVEADFLVNLYEETSSVEKIKAAYERIFKTATGKKICRQMFGIKE